MPKPVSKLADLDKVRDQIQDAAEARIVADELWEEAVAACVAEGVANTQIGRWAGVTEGAIRMYRKRKGL